MKLATLSALLISLLFINRAACIDDVIENSSKAEIPNVLLAKTTRSILQRDTLVRKCASEASDIDKDELFSIAYGEQMDLDSDGNQDYIFAVGSTCLPMHNLPTFVYQQTQPNRYKRLLETSSSTVKVLKTVTNNYHDLRSYVHVSVNKEYIYNYKYDLGAYHAVSCGIMTYIDQPNSEPKQQVTPAKCSELD